MSVQNILPISYAVRLEIVINSPIVYDSRHWIGNIKPVVYDQGGVQNISTITYSQGFTTKISNVVYDQGTQVTAIKNIRYSTISAFTHQMEIDPSNLLWD